MVLRFFQVAIGLLLFAAVIYLGFLASSDSRFVIWFGLAAALLAPGGIALISYAVTARSRQTLSQLSKVPEIEKLINEAESQEEKVRLLEQERERLVEAIELESRKQALDLRKDSLEKNAIDILNELEAIDTELNSLDVDIASSPARDAVRRLNERLSARQRGDVVLRLGSRYYSINRDIVLGMPMGRFLMFYLRIIESFTKKR